MKNLNKKSLSRRRFFYRAGVLSTAALGFPLTIPSAVAWNGARMRKPIRRESGIMGTISSLGISSGLKICLDAGNSSSYSSGQEWSDLSGNNHILLRGTTNGADTTDPTFNGTPGGNSVSEYWSFDGGDFFSLDGANPSWVNNLHDNNARFTIATWLYMTGSSSEGIIGNTNGTASPGFFFGRGSTGRLLFNAYRTGGASAIALSTTASLANGAWTFATLSFNEATGANGAFFGINDTYELENSTYSSPSTGAAGSTLVIGARQSGLGRLANGSRMALMMVWEGTNLSQIELTSLFEATRTRFGV